jgi:hypothetical protein
MKKKTIESSLDNRNTLITRERSHASALINRNIVKMGKRVSLYVCMRVCKRAKRTFVKFVTCSRTTAHEAQTNRQRFVHTSGGKKKKTRDVNKSEWA